MFKKESSFRIGCGRYIQGRGVLKQTAAQIQRIGDRPLILSGETAFRVAGERIVSSLEGAALAYDLEIYKGSCNIEAAETFAAQAQENKNGVIVGVGGGVMMDFAKLVARFAALPVLNIPTSTATCAAYTPLSVCYTAEGRTVGTVHHGDEVNAVLADTEILISQPPRLFLAGVFDALAKFLEIRHLYRPEDTSFALGLDYAYVLSVRSFEVLSKSMDACLASLEKGEITEEFEQAVFAAVCATGVISGIARGSSQTALAHKFYEIARALYPVETRPYLHGELVGIGLLLQNEFNGEGERNGQILSLMKKYGLPHSPAAAGVPFSEENLLAFLEKTMKSNKVKSEDGARLRAALEKFWRN